MPTVCTVLPSIVSGLIRLVTTATALIRPRLLRTSIRSPVTIPFSLRECLADLDELLRLQDGVDAGQCLIQKWKCSVSR